MKNSTGTFYLSLHWHIFIPYTLNEAQRIPTFSRMSGRSEVHIIMVIFEESFQIRFWSIDNNQYIFAEKVICPIIFYNE